MKHSLIPNLALLVFVILVSCSGADFSSKSSKGGTSSRLASTKGSAGETSSKSASTTENEGAGITNEPNSQLPPEKAAPPEEVTGAYLACDIFNTGPGDNASSAQVGCIAYDSNHARLDLTNLSVSWKIADKSGLSIASTDLPSSKYDKAWKLGYNSVSSGFDASISVSGTNGNKTLVQDHKYDRITQSVSGAVDFSAIAILPYNNSPSPMDFSTLIVNVPQAPFVLSNYSVSIVELDKTTGFCLTAKNLGTVSMTFRSPSGADMKLDMSTTIQLNGVSFCLKINTDVNVNGRRQTVSLYRR